VWAAAGLPDAVFEISVADLRHLADAKSARIAE
jgi:prolyl-tRNA editing enzyme YbaK/EbsC (Cys-tRNA(Pro) deacylase)